MITWKEGRKEWGEARKVACEENNYPRKYLYPLAGVSSILIGRVLGIILCGISDRTCFLGSLVKRLAQV
jgi:hypothetical protein